MASSFGLVRLESQSGDADAQLKLGQRFCLELTSDIDGYAAILQGLGDMWYPVQLDHDGNYETAVTAGSDVLPRFADGIRWVPGQSLLPSLAQVDHIGVLR